MAIIKHSCFALVLSALLSSVVEGQTGINFDVCKRQFDTRFTDDNNGNDDSFDTNREGSQRRTYGNLCTGSQSIIISNNNNNNNNDNEIDARIQDPFRKFCDLIDRYPNVLALMATGNSPHTVFAPTDAAFAKVDGLIGRVDDQKVLELHILPQARLTRDLRCGQTYRTINTDQDRRNNQRSKTRCVSAFRSQQLGPGNIKNGLKPTIGVPDNIFNAQEFESQSHFVLNFNNRDNVDDATRMTFSQDVISCNGVIHVVDEVMLPGNAGFISSGSSGYYGNGGSGSGDYYGSKGGYYAGGYGGGGGGGNNGGGANSYYSGTSGGNSYYLGGGGGGGYYGGKNSKGYGGKSFKKGKNSKGGGNAGYYVRSAVDNYRGNYGGNSYYNRALGEETAEDPHERYMSDAEFFGIDGLVESSEAEAEAEVESAEEKEDQEQQNEELYLNRKRRLEALLEPNGNIAQA